MKPLVGIVVVNYRSLKDIQRCIESVRALNYANYFVVLIDSRSPDASGLELRTYTNDPRIQLILSPDNNGFAAASNIGIKAAQVRNADYIWLLNPDTTCDPGALDELVDLLSVEPGAIAAGSKILYGDESPKARIWGAGGDVDFKAQEIRMRGAGELDCGQFEERADCGYLPGCSMLVRSSAIASVGYLPEEYFMYFEETDWCVRAVRLGWRLLYAPRSIVWHHFDDAKMQRPFGVYYFNRNQRLFWFRFSSLRGRLKIVAETVFRSLPNALRAKRQAPNSELREVFSAHVASGVDFLLGRFYERNV